MPNILGIVSNVFEYAIKTAFPDIPDPPINVTVSTKIEFGDYQCNSAMAIAGVSTATLVDPVHYTGFPRSRENGKK